MKCTKCGQVEMGSMPETIERHHYTESGLLNVYLEGVPVRRCPACGEAYFRIRAPGVLHRTIAETVARKPAPLTPAEFRFLRKHLGWTGAEAARRMGVTGEQVSRWEHGKTPISAMADRLIRAATKIGPDAFAPSEGTAPDEIRLAFDDGWKAA